MWSVRGLSAGYGSRMVLDSVDLDIPSGLATAVVGPGGCGKTSLLKALSGATEPADFWFDGEILSAPTSVRTVPQQRSKPQGVDGFMDLAKHWTGDEALILDEPFFGLSPADRQRLEPWFTDQRAASRTVLWVTHNLRLARQLSDYIVLLVEGRVVEAAPTVDFFERPQYSRTADFLVTGS